MINKIKLSLEEAVSMKLIDFDMFMYLLSKNFNSIIVYTVCEEISNVMFAEKIINNEQVYFRIKKRS